MSPPCPASARAILFCCRVRVLICPANTRTSFSVAITRYFLINRQQTEVMHFSRILYFLLFLESCRKLVVWFDLNCVCCRIVFNWNRIGFRCERRKSPLKYVGVREVAPRRNIDLPRMNPIFRRKLYIYLSLE